MEYLILVVLAFFYLVPTINAYCNNKKSREAIMLLNLFLGWTLIGWVIALVWSATKD